MGASTQKELGLYEHWPTITFTNSTKSYSLNPGPNVWPFSFSHFLSIADLAPVSTTVPTPLWTIPHPPDPDSPIAVFSEPKTASTPFLEWLCKTSMPFAKMARQVNIASPANDFDHLIVDILTNLIGRQDRKKPGHSGGVLIQHSGAKFLSFGAVGTGGDAFSEAIAIPSHLPSSRPIPAAQYLLSQSSPVASNLSDESMLIIYVVKGPEGVDRTFNDRRGRSESNYPGSNLL